MKSIKLKLLKENKSCGVDYTLPLPNEKCLSDYIFFSKNKFSSQHIIFYCHHEKDNVFPYDCSKVIDTISQQTSDDTMMLHNSNFLLNCLRSKEPLILSVLIDDNDAKPRKRL